MRETSPHGFSSVRPLLRNDFRSAGHSYVRSEPPQGGDEWRRGFPPRAATHRGHRRCTYGAANQGRDSDRVGDRASASSDAVDPTRDDERPTPVCPSSSGTARWLVQSVVPRRHWPQRRSVPLSARTGGQRARAQPACVLGGTEQNGSFVGWEFDDWARRGERSTELRLFRGTSKGSKAQGGSGRVTLATVCRFHGPLDGATPWSRERRRARGEAVNWQR
jgi:hypothetical protein